GVLECRLHVREPATLVPGVVARDVAKVLVDTRRHVKGRLIPRDLVQRGYQTWHRVLLRGARAVRRHSLHRYVLPKRALFGHADAVILELSVDDLVVAALGHQ